MTRDLTPAVDLILAYDARFARADFSLVRMWLEEGCDMERDILPALRACMAARSDIRSVAYFTPAVRRARDARQVAHAAALAEARKKTDPEARKGKASRIAWLRARFPDKHRCDAALRAWLEAYERENGPVEP